jgi:hypothetical protein
MKLLFVLIVLNGGHIDAYGPFTKKTVCQEMAAKVNTKTETYAAVCVPLK